MLLNEINWPYFNLIIVSQFEQLVPELGTSTAAHDWPKNGGKSHMLRFTAVREAGS